MGPGFVYVMERGGGDLLSDKSLGETFPILDAASTTSLVRGLGAQPSSFFRGQGKESGR